MQPEVHTTEDRESIQGQTESPNSKLRLRSALRDGYEVHRAALARGLNIRLLPRQVMEVSLPEDPSASTGFSHGIPQATTLAAVTYAQDLRVKRAMLLQAGLTVPRGATFSVGRSQRIGRNFAERIGFPVVVKPAVGDNTIEVQTGITTPRKLKKAIEYLYTPPSQRKKFTRSAFALTELREPGRINGKLVAPPGYRFLVEKHLHGQYLRFLIIDGVVRNVMFCADGPWETKGAEMKDVTSATHPTLLEIAERAYRAIPGLSVAAVDMVVADHTAKTTADEAPIVELSERPWLSIQYRHNEELASSLADEILEAGFPEAANRSENAEISVEVLIGGAVDPVTLLDVLSEKFTELGIQGDLHESDHTLGQIRGTVQGSPDNIAWVMERLLGKGIGGQRAMLVEMRQVAA